MDGTRTLIANVTGFTPDVCPAYALKDRLVADVLSIYQARESNLLEPMTGGWDNISRRVVAGLKHYDRAYRLARQYHRDREDEERESEYNRVRAKTGRGRHG